MAESIGLGRGDNNVAGISTALVVSGSYQCWSYQRKGAAACRRRALEIANGCRSRPREDLADSQESFPHEKSSYVGCAPVPSVGLC